MKRCQIIVSLTMITPHVSKPNTWRITIQKPKTKSKILSAASSKEFKSLPARASFRVRPFERAHSRHGDFLDQSAFCRRARRSKGYLHRRFRRQAHRRRGADSLGDADPCSGVSRPPRYRQRDSLPCARVDLVGLLDTGLIPFNREARIFADGVPIFPDSHGINSFALAERMVANLGPHYATLLRGHGVVVTGPGIEGACISAIQLERACQDQLLMMSITELKPLADAGRGRNNARLENPYRAWPFLLYKHKIKSKAQIRKDIRTLKEGEHY